MASVVVFELHRTCSHSLSDCIGYGFLLVNAAAVMKKSWDSSWGLTMQSTPPKSHLSFTFSQRRMVSLKALRAPIQGKPRALVQRTVRWSCCPIWVISWHALKASIRSHSFSFSSLCQASSKSACHISMLSQRCSQSKTLKDKCEKYKYPSLITSSVAIRS
jgi:hypothetical protein